jgi:uracil-DNA glycosylase
LHADARLLIVGQAPGRVAHLSGTPFDDASGDRLRQWLGLERNTFYDPRAVALLPMGFCYPGSSPAGDLAPRAECAPTWRAPLLAKLRAIELTVVMGRYAMDYHLPARKEALTETVRDWRTFWPNVVPLPHPSPRNQVWVKRNPWFARELLPELRRRVADIFAHAAS